MGRDDQLPAFHDTRGETFQGLRRMWATGIARATVDRYYYDRVNSFDREVLSRLCEFLAVKPGDLLVIVEQQVIRCRSGRLMTLDWLVDAVTPVSEDRVESRRQKERCARAIN